MNHDKREGVREIGFLCSFLLEKSLLIQFLFMMTCASVKYVSFVKMFETVFGKNFSD